jgi:hypothetical protein
MRTTDFMKMAAFQELKEALEIKRVNDDLLEYLASSLRYILYYSKKHNIPVPEREKIIELMDKAMNIENKSDDRIHPTKNRSSDEEEYRAKNHIVVILFFNSNQLAD